MQLAIDFYKTSVLSSMDIIKDRRFTLIFSTLLIRNDGFLFCTG